MDGVYTEDAMEGSWVSFLGVIETLIESDANEVDPLMAHEEEVVFPLKGRESSSQSKLIDSKEYSNILKGEDTKTYLAFSPSLKCLKGFHLKL